MASVSHSHVSGPSFLPILSLIREYVIPFSTEVPERDGRTDGRTDRQTDKGQLVMRPPIGGPRDNLQANLKTVTEPFLSFAPRGMASFNTAFAVRLFVTDMCMLQNCFTCSKCRNTSCCINNDT